MKRRKSWKAREGSELKEGKSWRIFFCCGDKYQSEGGDGIIVDHHPG